MNGCKILKCFRKEKCVSGELPCPATGLIYNQNLNLLEKHFYVISGGTWFYYSHMVMPVFPRAQR